MSGISSVSLGEPQLLQLTHYASYVNFVRFVLEHVPMRSCDSNVFAVEQHFFDFRWKIQKNSERWKVEERIFCSASSKKNLVLPLFIRYNVTSCPADFLCLYFSERIRGASLFSFRKTSEG